MSTASARPRRASSRRARRASQTLLASSGTSSATLAATARGPGSRITQPTIATPSWQAAVAHRARASHVSPTARTVFRAAPGAPVAGACAPPTSTCRARPGLIARTLPARRGRERVANRRVGPGLGPPRRSLAVRFAEQALVGARRVVRRALRRLDAVEMAICSSFVVPVLPSQLASSAPQFGPAVPRASSSSSPPQPPRASAANARTATAWRASCARCALSRRHGRAPGALARAEQEVGEGEGDVEVGVVHDAWVVVARVVATERAHAGQRADARARIGW